MGDQAAGAGLHPGDPAELLPFIEAYALAGRTDQARSLSQQAINQPSLQPALCAVWMRVGANGAQYAASAAEMQAGLGCQ